MGILWALHGCYRMYSVKYKDYQLDNLATVLVGLSSGIQVLATMLNTVSVYTCTQCFFYTLSCQS